MSREQNMNIFFINYESLITLNVCVYNKLLIYGDEERYFILFMMTIVLF